MSRDPYQRLLTYAEHAPRCKRCKLVLLPGETADDKGRCPTCADRAAGTMKP